MLVIQKPVCFLDTTIDNIFTGVSMQEDCYIPSGITFLYYSYRNWV